MIPFKSLEIANQIKLLQKLKIFVAQINQSENLPPQSDPLIDKSGEYAIYIGVFLLFVLIIFAIGIFNRRFDYAIIISLILAAILMFVLWTL
ncbi:MAG: hypothetical protein KI793_06300 [Rivularia sp. (in: Bacteria)]|nr:hypothetical protein [Rivularia sp. MS3]